VCFVWGEIKREKRKGGFLGGGGGGGGSVYRWCNCQLFPNQSRGIFALGGFVSLKKTRSHPKMYGHF